MITAEWTEESAGLRRTFVFKDFREALAFTVEVGVLAEEVQHHPDIDLRWNKVLLVLVTHEAGDQITEKDRQLAIRINGISPEKVLARVKQLSKA